MKKLKDLQILYKIVIAFTFVIIITCITGYLSYRNLNNQEVTIKEVGYNILPSIQSLLTLYQAETSVLSAERALLNPDLKDVKVRNSIYESFPTAFKRADEAWKIYEPLKRSDEEEALWKKFVLDWDTWKKTHQSVIETQKKIDQFLEQSGGKESTEISSLKKECNNLSVIVLQKFDASKMSLKELVSINQAKAEKFSQDALISVDTTRKETIISIIISFFLVIGLITLVNKLFIKPIKQLDKNANDIINGNYNVQFEINRKDEIGNLNVSFHRMIDNIKNEISRSKSFQLGVNGAFFMADKDKSIKFINQAACSLMKFTKSPEEIIGKLKVKDVFLNDSITERAWHGDFIKSAKGEIKDHEGNIVPVLIQSGPINNSSNELDGVFVFFTDLKELELKQKEYLKKQIAPIAKIIKSVAEGDFTDRLHLDDHSDLYDLSNDINRMIEDLRTTLERVMEAVQATASAAEQISASSEELAAGTKEESMQISEIAQSIDEMTNTILEATKNVGQVSQLSKIASNAAQDGTQKTENTKQGMNKIEASSKQTADIISLLSGKTDQIGEIAHVIDDIANQTNLLALNAAIEAARAGEQGRGFAVVADEVRKLAERTTKATKEIAETIRAIQKEVKEADTSMSLAKVSVDEGMKLTEEVDLVLKDIFYGTTNVSNVINDVAVSSEQQSKAAEEISRNIVSITNVTQQSALGTSQIAHAAEDLSRLTISLQDLIRKFKTSGKVHSKNSNKELVFNEIRN